MVIETEDLTKYYGPKVGCEKVCLSVRRGHIFGFLGPNGAGKSTFVKMIVGLTSPTAGRAEVLGHPLGDVAARARIGFLPENFKYQDWLTPTEMLTFHGRLVGMDRASLASAIRESLATVGLAGEAGTKIRAFSKGMQQRLGLACALLSSPELLLLDEPTSALDPVGRREIRELLLAVRERGTTVFLNSHLLSEVEMVCDEVAVIDRGRVAAAGALADLLSGPCEVQIALAEALTFSPERPVAKAHGRVLLLEDSLLLVGLDSDDEIPALVEHLVAAGTKIKGVERRKRTLESLFLEAVGERPRE